MKIAITGGIGSGKSYVCRILEKHGIRVYDCDAAAKRLMRTSDELRHKLTRLVGDDVYAADGTLQKRTLAEFLLTSETNKQAVNDVVHPAVAADFIASGMEWLECAILFESGFDTRIKFDYIICVVAPTDVRIQRIAARDKITTDKAREWIDAQMPQEEAAQRSNFVINNDGTADVLRQVADIERILKAANNTAVNKEQ